MFHVEQQGSKLQVLRIFDGKFFCVKFISLKVNGRFQKISRTARIYFQSAIKMRIFFDMSWQILFVG